MTRAATARAAAGVLLASLLAVGTATADPHRVAAVDPDAQLARALELALSPWGVAVVQVHLEAPGATMPIAVDRARAIARDADAEVVTWVSSAEGGYALWIYDVASDHAGARELDGGPPFDAATSAAVALAVKTLLRGTLVAPPPERFGAAPQDAAWLLGAYGGAAAYVASSWLLQGRLGVEGAVWPARFGHRWGGTLGIDYGVGAHAGAGAFAGTLTDTGVRLALAWRAPLSESVALEPSLGGGARLVTLDGTVLPDGSHVSIARVDVTVTPRVSLGVAAWGGRLRLAPWVGVAMLTRWQRFFVHHVAVLELGPLAPEGALSAALAFP